MRRSLTLLLALLLATGGCALVDRRDRVGSLLLSWSQGEYRSIDDWAPSRTIVIGDTTERDAFLAGLPDEVDAGAVETADLDRSFLVLDSYPKCRERSRVWMDRQRTAVWFEVYVPRGEEQIACAWSPLTVDVWRIPRSELRTTGPGDLQTSEPA